MNSSSLCILPWSSCSCSSSSGTAISPLLHGELILPTYFHPNGNLTVSVFLRDYFIATAAVYVPAWIFPWLRTCFEYGLGQKAHISVEENGFTRISIPANFDWVPGQHCFLRFTSFGLGATLTSHPFTICSLPSTSTTKRQSEAIFYVRHQGGFTAKLHDYAMQHAGASIPVLLDGPYGGVNLLKFIANDHILVIAGGSGAGWPIPFIEQFIRLHSVVPDEEKSQLVNTNVKGTQVVTRAESGTVRSLHVILATRDIITRDWYRQTDPARAFGRTCLV